MMGQPRTVRKRREVRGHVFRYHPAVQDLRRRISEGELGNIQTTTGNRETFGLPRKDMGASRDWNFRPIAVRNGAGKFKVLWCYTERYSHFDPEYWESMLFAYPGYQFSR
jgi:hypothetical protein